LFEPELVDPNMEINFVKSSMAAMQFQHINLLQGRQRTEFKHIAKCRKRNQQGFHL